MVVTSHGGDGYTTGLVIEKKFDANDKLAKTSGCRSIQGRRQGPRISLE